MYFDGNKFATTQTKAFEFPTMREAIYRVRLERWFHLQIIIVYDDNSSFRVSGWSFDLPDGVVYGLALKNQAARRKAS